MNIGETDGAIMSDVKPVAWVIDTMLERVVASGAIVRVEMTRTKEDRDDVPLYSQESIGALQAEIEALRKDGERFAWVLPIINGECDKFADARTAALARQFLLGENGRDAIDAAIAKEKQQECLK